MENIILNLKKIFLEALICKEEDLDLKKPYVELGVDSILAIQITTLIFQIFKIRIKTSDLFNHISINDLAHFIAKKIEASTVGSISESLLNCSNIPQMDQECAIVGMAGYFPGSDNVKTFWEHLLSGNNSIKTVTRWENGKRWKGGFIERIDTFDAAFFDISPKEARLIDPQQRLFLEVAWQAFEDAGFTKELLNNYQCGIYVGTLPGDYKYLLEDSHNKHSAHSFTGNAISAISARIAYTFNLKGPCLTLDTACSSALVSLHVAVESLLQGSCKAALVGATALFCTPEIFLFAENSNFLSPSGKCSVFDHRADGFVPAECVAAVVIKTVNQAKQDGDHIYAIIKGTAVNHDGRTNGLMSPNSYSQKELISMLYQKKNIDPKQVGYVEAHGTGTTIGDPIEVQALKEAFEERGDHKTYIGSCKANIGHALTASGLASLIKSVHILNTQLIPPQLHYTKQNDQIEMGSFHVPLQTTPFPKDKLYVSLSAFGFTGTNAHVVLEKFSTEKPTTSLQLQPLLFVFSAHDQETLKNVIGNISIFLENFAEHDLTSLSYTLCCCRTLFKEATWGIVVNSLKELRTALKEKITNGISSQVKKEEKKNTLQTILKNLIQGKLYPTTELRLLYKDPVQKLSLPPYPFHRERFWPSELKRAHLPQLISPPHETKLENYFKQKFAELLEYPIESICVKKPLTEYGLDSLIALELIKPLQKKFPTLTPNSIFKYRSIRELVNFLLSSAQKPQLFPALSSPLLAITKFPYCNIKRKGNIEYVVYGKEGELLLFLPPLNTTADAWIQQLRFFAKLPYRLLIPHYPGHAGSIMDEHQIPCNLRKLSEIILNLANQEASEQKQFHVIGWSLGGCLSLLLALNHPDSIASLTLINTAAAFPTKLFEETIALREELSAYEALLKQIFFSEKNESVIDLFQAYCPLEKLKHYYDALESFNVQSCLSDIYQPTLILHGKNDCVIKEHSINSLSSIPHSQVISFKNQGHFLPLTGGLSCSQALLKFLKRTVVSNKR